MADSNTIDHKRFIYRPSNKKSTKHQTKENTSKLNHSLKLSQQIESAPTVPMSPSPQMVPRHDISRSKDTPARRVVVIRNTKHVDVNQNPVDFGNFGQNNSEKIQPVISNGNKSVYFIRRPIVRVEPIEPVE